MAEDALSELCLVACENVQTLKNHVCPKAWLIITAKFVSITLTREYQKKCKHLPINELMVGSKELDVFEEVLFSTWTENDAPQKLISLLTKREAQVYKMLYQEGKSVKEIAQELNVVENTVRNIHKHLRDKIPDAIKRNIF